MRRIAHRGNRHGPNPERENEPGYILEALAEGFDCEIDVRWLKDKWYLGHNTPDYLVPSSFLTLPGLWVHLKDAATVSVMQLQPTLCNWFWHEVDNIAFTSRGNGWTGNPEFRSQKNILMISDISWLEIPFKEYHFYGCCNDWIGEKVRNDPASDWVVS